MGTTLSGKPSDRWTRLIGFHVWRSPGDRHWTLGTLRREHAATVRAVRRIQQKHLDLARPTDWLIGYEVAMDHVLAWLEKRKR